jgi:hypothetical protein
VRLVAPRLGGGKELGELLLRAAWAEQRRVKGTGPDARWARFRRFRAPLLDACARAPYVAAAQVSRRSGDRDHHACVGQGRLRFRFPAKGAGCRAARVLGSLRKYVNVRGIAPTARPTDLRSRGLR